MAWYDSIPGVSLFTGHDRVQQQPGTGASNPNGQNTVVNSDGKGGLINPRTGEPLTKDPTTGMFYDPSSGLTYQQNGTPITDPNLAQQVAKNFSQAQGLIAQGSDQNASLDKTEAAQQGLASALNNVINNPNAPSVAKTQLAQAQDNTAKAILGQAAGVSGNNAYDARRTAIQALGNSETQNAGNAALLRANEVQSAEQGLGSTLNSLGAGQRARQAIDYTTGTQLSGQAQGGQEAQQGLNQKAQQSNLEQDDKLTGAIIGGISAGGST